MLVSDAPEKDLYPMQAVCGNRDAVYVGRLREGNTVKNGVKNWISADKLRKGASLNGVEIAELVVKKDK